MDAQIGLVCALVLSIGATGVLADHLTPEIEFIGCFTDTRARDLALALPIWGKGNLNPNSPFLCATRCFHEGFTYAGVQYSHECFCGDSFGKHGQLADGACTTPCRGNTDEICGGTWKNSIYKVAGDDPVAIVSCPADNLFMSGLPTITLDGQASTDDVGPLTFSWTQTGGSVAALPAPGASDPWTISNAADLAADVYSFELTVTDTYGHTDTAECTFTIVDDIAPVVGAICPNECQSSIDLDDNPMIFLDGTSSSDNSGSVTVTWVQVGECAKSAATLNDLGGGMWKITNGDELKHGCYSFEVTATDGSENTATMMCEFIISKHLKNCHADGRLPCTCGDSNQSSADEPSMDDE